jgi:hypothetical protein
MPPLPPLGATPILPQDLDEPLPHHHHNGHDLVTGGFAVLVFLILLIPLYKSCKRVRGYPGGGISGSRPPGERIATLDTRQHYVRSTLFHMWMERKEYDRRKAKWKSRRQWLRDQFAWKTTNADYSWVWWDPGGTKAARHEVDKKALRWIPECLRSYSCPTADSIWNREYFVQDLAGLRAHEIRKFSQRICQKRPRVSSVDRSHSLAPTNTANTSPLSPASPREPQISYAEIPALPSYPNTAFLKRLTLDVLSINSASDDDDDPPNYSPGKVRVSRNGRIIGDSSPPAIGQIRLELDRAAPRPKIARIRSNPTVPHAQNQSFRKSLKLNVLRTRPHVPKIRGVSLPIKLRTQPTPFCPVSEPRLKRSPSLPIITPALREQRLFAWSLEHLYCQSALRTSNKLKREASLLSVEALLQDPPAPLLKERCKTKIRTWAAEVKTLAERSTRRKQRPKISELPSSSQTRESTKRSRNPGKRPELNRPHESPFGADGNYDRSMSNDSVIRAPLDQVNQHVPWKSRLSPSGRSRGVVTSDLAFSDADSGGSHYVNEERRFVDYKVVHIGYESSYKNRQKQIFNKATSWQFCRCYSCRASPPSIELSKELKNHPLDSSQPKVYAVEARVQRAFARPPEHEVERPTSRPLLGETFPPPPTPEYLAQGWTAAKNRKTVSFSISNASANHLRLDSRVPDIFLPANLDDEKFAEELNRKLTWLAYELSPGRTVFNWATFAATPLNPEWHVGYDGPARPSQYQKRKHGDPRFMNNDDQRAFRYEAPPPRRERKKEPQIKTWRLIINNRRRSSGLKDLLKSIEQFEGSAEEPREGRIDTANWILRRPPQGFGMSTAQKNAYYEGELGWFETLEKWKRVKYTYLIRRYWKEGQNNRPTLRRYGRVARRKTTARVEKTYRRTKQTRNTIKLAFRMRHELGVPRDHRISRMTANHTQRPAQPEKRLSTTSSHADSQVFGRLPGRRNTTDTELGECGAPPAHSDESWHDEILRKVTSSGVSPPESGSNPPIRSWDVERKNHSGKATVNSPRIPFHQVSPENHSRGYFDFEPKKHPERHFDGVEQVIGPIGQSSYTGVGKSPSLRKEVLIRVVDDATDPETERTVPSPALLNAESELRDAENRGETRRPGYLVVKPDVSVKVSVSSSASFSEDGDSQMSGKWTQLEELSSTIHDLFQAVRPTEILGDNFIPTMQGLSIPLCPTSTPEDVSIEVAAIHSGSAAPYPRGIEGRILKGEDVTSSESITPELTQEEIQGEEYSADVPTRRNKSHSSASSVDFNVLGHPLSSSRGTQSHLESTLPQQTESERRATAMGTPAIYSGTTNVKRLSLTKAFSGGICETLPISSC